MPDDPPARPDEAKSTDSPPVDKAALRAWYAANYQSAGPAEETSPAANLTPDRNQELPAVTPELLSELRARREASPAGDAGGRTARAPSGPQRAAAGSPEAAAASQSRRQQAELLRQQSQRKSLRFRLFLFCAMLLGTVVCAIAIWWLIQTKFGGKIPYL